MAYGGPASMEGVEAYYTHIRGGRRPSPEQLADLEGRYRSIGGLSPLLNITRDQASALQLSLSESGSETRVYTGMKHSEPFIGGAVDLARSDGVDRLLCVALAPHYSGMSIGGYKRAVDEACDRSLGAIEPRFVRSWHNNPLLVSLWSERIRRLGPQAGESYEVIFSAHSLPERIIREGDPYKDQLLETSGLVADAAGNVPWSFAFQSASTTGEPWLGPDILKHLQSRYDAGIRSFVLAPIGFVSDHLEILYDIDVECVGWSKKTGATLLRCPSPNVTPEFIACLRSIVDNEGFS